jgi:hypothetical protein
MLDNEPLAELLAPGFGEIGLPRQMRQPGVGDLFEGGSPRGTRSFPRSTCWPRASGVSAAHGGHHCQYDGVGRINIHHTYKLIVDGTAPHGFTNTSGELLDGADTGHADSDYHASLTWRNRVLDPPWPKASSK